MVSSKRDAKKASTTSGLSPAAAMDDFQDDYADQIKTTRKFPSSPSYIRSSRSANARTSTSAAAPGLDDGLTSDEDFDRLYDLTPVEPPDFSLPTSKQQLRESQSPRRSSTTRIAPRYSIDPWEADNGRFPFR